MELIKETGLDIRSIRDRSESDRPLSYNLKSGAQRGKSLPQTSE